MPLANKSFDFLENFPTFSCPAWHGSSLAFSAPFSLDNNYLFDKKILIKKNPPRAYIYFKFYY